MLILRLAAPDDLAAFVDRVCLVGFPSKPHKVGHPSVLPQKRVWPPALGTASADDLTALVDRARLELDAARTAEVDDLAPLPCSDGRTWDRTRDLSRVKRALSR